LRKKKPYPYIFSKEVLIEEIPMYRIIYEYS